MAQVFGELPRSQKKDINLSALMRQWLASCGMGFKNIGY